MFGCYMVRAVILAAGASSRMGTSKAALTLNQTGETFVSRLIRQFADAGLPDIVVVTGADAPSVHRGLGRTRRRVRVVHNQHWANGQLTSLLKGLEERPGDRLEAVMVTLVDIPLVTSDTIKRVLAAWRASGAPIVRPARGEQHGHPVIFDRTVFGALFSADPAVGAKAVVRAQASRIVNVAVDDPGAFRDIDTPDDYQHTLRELRI
jgi:CTP:molybdopterin cytidylyltransferase MocA